MTVNKETAVKILEVVEKHVDRNQLFNILTELQDIPGSKNFRDNVSTLLEQFEE